MSCLGTACEAAAVYHRGRGVGPSPIKIDKDPNRSIVAQNIGGSCFPCRPVAVGVLPVIIVELTVTVVLDGSTAVPGFKYFEHLPIFAAQ